ncbi:MAG: SAR2788 family putative toxin [Actinomycetaceae bacterium]|nr:SAR2788 family putative toxin [Actinomycetaceae bacterium]
MIKTKSIFVTFVAAITSLTLGMSTAFASVPLSQDQITADNTKIVSDQQVEEDLATHVSNEKFSRDDSWEAVEKKVTVAVKQVDGKAEVSLHESGNLSIATSAVVDGKKINDNFDVIDINFIGDNVETFVAVLQSKSTGKLIKLGAEIAQPQAFPALLVLGAVARIGIKTAIKAYTKTQIKKAAKSYLLRTLDRNSWIHIMKPKHKWSSVGAKSREQIAEIVGQAMANGRHVTKKWYTEVSYWYKGKQVIVRYSKGGKISNAWVK